MVDVNWLPHDGWPRLAADFVWQSTLIGCLGWLASVALQRRPAARAYVCVLALALCLFVPLATLAVRHAGWGLLPPDPATQWNASYPSAELQSSEQRGLAVWPAPAVVRLPNPWSELAWCIARLAWYLVTAWFVIRLTMSVCSLVRLLQGRTPCHAVSVNAAARVAARQIGLRGRVEVAHGDAVASPTVWACGRSTTVFLPPGACGQPHDWLSVFCHELAHARRGDPWSRLLAEIAVAVLPWQPFVWLLRRHYLHASEEACDDWAVALGCEPDELADTLVNWLPVAQAGGLAPSLRSKVMERVRRLLAMTSLPRPALGVSWRVSTMALAACVAILLALAQTRSPLAHSHALPAAGWDGPRAEDGTSSHPDAVGVSQREAGPQTGARSAVPVHHALPRLNGCVQHVLGLLAMEEVRRDLRLSSHAYLALKLETEAAQSELEQLLHSAPQRHDPEQWWQWVRKVGDLKRELLACVESRLSQVQLERLRQIIWQSYGGAALLDPQVAGQLQMSLQQRRMLWTIYQESSARLRDLFAQTEEAGLPRDAAQACAAELRQQRDERLLGVLTPAQRDAFVRLTGRKLEIDTARLFSRLVGETRS